MSAPGSTRAAAARTEPAAIELIEEAVHLLRRAPAGVLAIYYAGTVPFVLGLLFFWARAAWFRPGGAALAWGALGLVALFVGLKTAQAEFCARLLAQRIGKEPATWTWRRGLALATAQLRLQPWLLFVLPPAAVLGVPFGWVFAYGQSATVLGAETALHREAAGQAKLWPAQNHLALLLIAVVALAAWINLAAAFFVVPWLANRLLGLDNVFGFTGTFFLNSTFLGSVTALAWLTVDPLVKAFYTLRVFHGRARRTGEDLRVEFRRAGRGALRAGAAAVLLGVCLALPAVPVRAATPPRPDAVQTAELDRAIDAVLAGGDFRWRLPPVAEDTEKDGPLKAFFREGARMLSDTIRTLEEWWRRISEWWERRFPGSDRPKHDRRGAGAGTQQVLTLLLYGFVGACALLVAWVGWLVWRQARRVPVPVLAARVVATAAPDLRDENVQAAQLPADGWLALAREQAALGEWRLAWRALYLATLARLAAEGLLSLAKFKTNLDYERELRRRALSRTGLVARFAARRRDFEAVWYGRAEPAEAAVRAWLAELERPEAP